MRLYGLSCKYFVVIFISDLRSFHSISEGKQKINKRINVSCNYIYYINEIKVKSAKSVFSLLL